MNYTTASGKQNPLDLMHTIDLKETYIIDIYNKSTICLCSYTCFNEPFDMIIKETVIEAEKFHNCTKSMAKLFKKLEIIKAISDEKTKTKK